MAVNRDPDAILMLRVQRGDVAAFEELVDKYKRPVMNLVYRTLPDATQAEDLAQSVFVQVYKSAHRYRAAAKFSTWLFTIARNLCLNEIRRRSRHRVESLDAPPPGIEEEGWTPTVPAAGCGPDEAALQGELVVKIEQAIRALPENQRIAIALCREQDVAYEQIAEVLGCSLSATKSLIHRARETLKEKLKPYLKTGAWQGKT